MIKKQVYMKLYLERFEKKKCSIFKIMSNPFKESYISSARSSFSKKPIKFLKMLKAHLYIGFRKSHSFRVSLPFQLTEITVKIYITNHTI